jgi:hypothetical protein
MEFLMDITLQFSLMGLLVLVKLTRMILHLFYAKNKLFNFFIFRMLGTESNPGIMFQTLKELFFKMQEFKLDR